jgi:uncharacterized protein YkwD
MKAFFLFFSLVSFLKPAPPQVDRQEAKKAYTLLNTIRANPAGFTDEMPFLAEISKKHPLLWNDTLALVAEAKAMDMANRRYVGHVDPDGYGMNYFIHKAGYKLQDKWLASKEANYFESISAGAPSGEVAIKTLLIDKNVPSLGHRKHLLGLDDWNASMADIGIGYVKADENSPYKSYVCVLIARHIW